MGLNEGKSGRDVLQVHVGKVEEDLWLLCSILD